MTTAQKFNIDYDALTKNDIQHLLWFHLDDLTSRQARRVVIIHDEYQSGNEMALLMAAWFKPIIDEHSMRSLVKDFRDLISNLDPWA